LKRFTPLVLSVAVLAALLSGCGTRPPAPVVDRGPMTRETLPVPPPTVTPQEPTVIVGAPIAAPTPTTTETHVVRRGDNLFSIARLYGLNPRDLAQWNGIPMDVVVREGTVLRLLAPGASGGPVTPLPPIATSTPPPSGPSAPGGEVRREPKAVKVPYSDEALAKIKGPAARAAAPVPLTLPASAAAALPPPPGKAAAPAPASANATPPAAAPAPVAPATAIEADNISWQRPVAGKQIYGFSEAAVMRGLGIAGKAGTPIYAAAAGRVVYAGEGLRGYGKMVILRHNESYTSVYGHNSVVIVQQGDTVKRGQKIAEMGDTETDTTKLHFEVRRGGKQVDPAKVIPAQ
jgi:lipoprotein NlpD